MASYNWLLLGVGLLTAASKCTATQFGRCNETYFLTRALGCEDKFFQALASDHTANCSSLYQTHVEQCYNHTLLTCFRDTRAGWRGIIQLALLMLEVMGSAQFYCTDVELDQLSRLPARLRAHIPCSDQYLVAGQNCSKRFRHLLASDRTDPRLCKEYDYTRECTAAIANAHCNSTFDVPDELDDVNPFCSAIVLAQDPSSTPDSNPVLAFINNKGDGKARTTAQAWTAELPCSDAGHAHIEMFLLVVVIQCALSGFYH